MVIEIKKDTPTKDVKKILASLKNKKAPKKDISQFFGKVPDLIDGLDFQKKARNEWK